MGNAVLLMPLAGVFHPIESLPGVLQPIARAIPLTRVFEATREGLQLGRIAWGQLGLAALGSLIAVAAATLFLDRQLRRFRSEGWVRRFT